MAVVTRRSSSSTFEWSPLDKAKNDAWVPVVPLTPRNGSQAATRRTSSRSSAKSCAHKQARLPTVTGWSDLKVRVAKTRLCPPLQRELPQQVQDVGEPLLQLTQRRTVDHQIGIVGDEAAGRSEVDDRLGLRGQFAIVMDVRHDVVAQFLLELSHPVPVELVPMALEVVDLLLRDREAELVLGLRQADPEVAPGGVAHAGREEASHRRARVAFDEWVIEAVAAFHASLSNRRLAALPRSAGHPDLTAAGLPASWNPDAAAAALVHHTPPTMTAAVDDPAIGGRDVLVAPVARHQDLLMDGLPVTVRATATTAVVVTVATAVVASHHHRAAQVAAKTRLERDLSRSRDGEPKEDRHEQGESLHDAPLSARTAPEMRDFVRRDPFPDKAL